MSVHRLHAQPAFLPASPDDPRPVRGNARDLAALAREMPYREPTTAPYEKLTPMQKHRIAASDPTRFEALRADWKRRGSPDCAVDLDAAGSGVSVRPLSTNEAARRIQR